MEDGICVGPKQTQMKFRKLLQQQRAKWTNKIKFKTLKPSLHFYIFAAIVSNMTNTIFFEGKISPSNKWHCEFDSQGNGPFLDLLMTFFTILFG